MLVKLQLDKLLLSLLGRPELVEDWWYRENKAFDNNTPYSVYQSGEEGRKKVNEFVLKSCNE